MKHPKFTTTPAISRRMSRVRLKKGRAEVALAKALWRRGLRYRYNFRKLPGSPDIVIAKYGIAIFVDGEFWHGYNWEIRKAKLKSNREYWIEKIEENIARDKRNDILLEEQGWRVLHFWEKDIKKYLDGCVNDVLEAVLERMTENSYSVEDED